MTRHPTGAAIVHRTCTGAAHEGVARGSVFKKPSGNYAYRAGIGHDPATGQRRLLQQSGFKTKREAEAALDEVLGAVRTGTVVNQRHHAGRLPR
jgi:hypothetical protein